MFLVLHSMVNGERLTKLLCGYLAVEPWPYNAISSVCLSTDKLAFRQCWINASRSWLSQDILSVSSVKVESDSKGCIGLQVEDVHR